jgi:thymidylate synthase
MQVINARSVSEALAMGLYAVKGGIHQPSRVGDVIVSPRPVMTVYNDPTNRVLFSPMRDANPFFHVMEALWMLAGRNDLPWLTCFNKRFASYSDDGGATQPGAYGYRWRNYFGHDQLMDIILELRQNPQTRRCVLAMWDGGARVAYANPDASMSRVVQAGDLFAAVSGSADVPCNTHAYFDTIDGRLNMTVCCRSNDIIWGAYGANAVHFSFLLEYMSLATGIPMGVYRQFSNNFHIYTNVVPEEMMMPMARDVEINDRYLMKENIHALNKVPAVPALRKVPLMDQTLESFEEDLQRFMSPHPTGPYINDFFSKVAQPMHDAHAYYRDKQYNMAIDMADLIKSEDWRIACTEWLLRRKTKAKVNTKPFTEIVETNTFNQDVDNAFGLEERTDGAA